MGAGGARRSDLSLGSLSPPWLGAHDALIGVASFIGTLWLNALKMTVIPLVVALLVVGISKSAEAAHAGRIAGRSVIWIAIICTASAVFGALMILLLTHALPTAPRNAAGLQTRACRNRAARRQRHFRVLPSSSRA